MGLLQRMHTDPSFNRTHWLWWETQPPPGDLLSSELLPLDLVPLLQSQWLVGAQAGWPAGRVVRWWVAEAGRGLGCSMWGRPGCC